MSAKCRIGIDIGGTFTDIVMLDEAGCVSVVKVASTPSNYAEGIRNGLLQAFPVWSIAGGDVAEVVHGTTVATNTILEKKGGKVGLLTTAGFRDVLEIRRLRMPRLYDLTWRKPEVLVPRRRRMEVVERIDYRGDVLEALDDDSARFAIDALLAQGVDAIAVCLLNAYANPLHEQRLRELIVAAAPDIRLCLSSEVLPEIKEYERTSTTVVNAYIAPVVESYLHSLAEIMRSLDVVAPVQVMQSNGGIMSLEAAAALPIHLIESGPAAGVVAAAELAARLGESDLLTFDMGGTTAKASIVEGGAFERVGELDVGAGINAGGRLLGGGGYLVRVPAIDIAEVGAGGGSLVELDAAGALKVGPESAGADPGPVCYGLGNDVPTVTDANVVLGFLNPEYLVGGELKIDAAASRAAIQTCIAEPLGLSVEDAAWGIHLVADATMVRALRAVSSERGRDPREFSLMAFGGNGGVHGVSLAASMDIERVLVPPVAGVFSALGLLFPESQRHLSRTFKRAVADAEQAELIAAFDELELSARRALQRDGYVGTAVRIERRADLRYAGENSELSVLADKPGDCAIGTDLVTNEVALLADIAELFHDEHETTYGYQSREEIVELVNLRIVATGLAAAARVPHQLSLARVDSLHSKRLRRMYFGADIGWVEARIYSRSGLADEGVSGPVVIEDYDSTTIVPPGYRCRRGEWDLLVITK
jgi:N-methylhydantoinase A